MPLDDGWLESAERPGQPPGLGNGPEEDGGAEGEVGGDDGARPDAAHRGGYPVAVVLPAGRRDDEAADAGGQGDCEVGRDRLAPRGVDHDVAAGDRRELVTPGRRTSAHRDDVAALTQPG